jgi:mannose-1-phosphate guanylyltransferase
MQMIPVILSGGSGTSLWTLSSKQYPKQYLPLAIDNTIQRLSRLDSLMDPIIVERTDALF